MNLMSQEIQFRSTIGSDLSFAYPPVHTRSVRLPNTARARIKEGFRVEAKHWAVLNILVLSNHRRGNRSDAKVFHISHSKYSSPF